MAQYYHQGIIIKEISGKIAGIRLAPGHRPTPDFSKYTTTRPSPGWTPATMKAMSRSAKSLKYKQWNAAHVDIPGFRRAQRDFHLAVEDFFRRQQEALWAGPDPGDAKALPGKAGGPGWQGPKGPKSADKPITDPKKPWWVSPPTYKAPCHAQKICDIAYQNLSEQTRLLWRQACTRLYRTPYDVYMHYNIPRVLRGVPGVKTPPPLAGWKSRGIEQDSDYFASETHEPDRPYPDASCQTWGLSWVHVQFAKRVRWDGFKWITDYGTLWSIYANVGLEPAPDQGFLDLTVYSGYRGEGQSATYDNAWWPIMESNPWFVDFAPHSADLTWTPARRHSDGRLYDPPTKDPYKRILVKNLNTGWSWGHYRLPYPSGKCTTGSMSYWLKLWPTIPGETITPYV